jgi:hypothetical protein
MSLNGLKFGFGLYLARLQNGHGLKSSFDDTFGILGLSVPEGKLQV